MSLETTTLKEVVPVARRHWTREEAIGAILLWLREEGQPPKYVDWTPSRGRVRDSVLRGHWPTGRQIIRLFGSWNGAMKAAGIKPRPPWRPKKEK